MSTVYIRAIESRGGHDSEMSTVYIRAIESRGGLVNEMFITVHLRVSDFL